MNRRNFFAIFLSLLYSLLLTSCKPLTQDDTPKNKVLPYNYSNSYDMNMPDNDEGLYIIPLYTAQLVHDGSLQTIEIDASNTEAGQYYTLRVIGAGGKIIWQADAGFAHAGWNSIFLARINGKEYLMQYNPYMIQGSGSYSFRVFSLGKEGNEIVLDKDEVDFGTNPPGVYGHFRKQDIEPVKTFYNHVNQYLANSELLLNTDDHIAELIPEENRGRKHGTHEDPIAGLQDYFYMGADLTIDEQLDLFVYHYYDENDDLED